MSGLTAWLLVGLSFGVVVVRRPSTAVGLVTAQALALALAAITAHQSGWARSGDAVITAIMLAARALALGALFRYAMARSRDTQPVAGRFSPVVRASVAVALALALSALVPGFGLTSPAGEGAVLTLVATGLACAATRRATLFQVLGIVLVENGLALAALGSPRGSLVVELGVTFDLTLIAVVAAMFHLRIFAELGAGDSTVLRSLHD
ncbi:MAG TPA: hypothetical protein VNF47_26025 [Streptosporangiaceae bacterium]|nr:hypothetical protein [Streptosporangiaceae bacterium]